MLLAASYYNKQEYIRFRVGSEQFLIYSAFMNWMGRCIISGGPSVYVIG